LTLNRGVEPHLHDLNFHASLSKDESFRLTRGYRRAAHNLIFFLFSAKPSLLRTAIIDLHRYLARLPLSHTVKELVSRGLKSRSGGSHRDRRFVSRSPSVVATGGTYSPHPTRVNPFCGVFWKFFQMTSQVVGNEVYFLG
jgi:hypothetical protein